MKRGSNWPSQKKLLSKSPVLIFDTTHSMSKQHAQMIIVININTLKVEKGESCSGAKKKLRGWKKTRLTWKMNDICEGAVPKVEFFQHYLPQIKVLTCIPRLAFFDLDLWNFIIGWRYNFNSICLSVLQFFTSQLFGPPVVAWRTL